MFPGLQCRNTAQYSNLLQINLIMNLYLAILLRKNFHHNYIIYIYARVHYVVLHRKPEEKLIVTNLKKAKLETGLSLLKHSGN